MIELTIKSLSHEGRGVAQLNGKTIFVDGALPDEKVRCEYTKKHKRFDEARVIDIIESSPFRVEPQCPHFMICGGCNLQHVDADQQITLKQQTLLEQLQHFGSIIPETILPPLRGENWGYRSKGRLGVKYVEKKQSLLVGFHEKNGRYIADLSTCEVLDPRVGHQITALKQLISGLSVYRQLPQIEIAADENKVALIFRHLADLSHDDKVKLIQFGKEMQFDIYCYPNPPQQLYRLWPDSGEEYLQYQLTDHNVTLQFYPTDFTQVNNSVNQKMVNLALELLELNASDKVLDLFCGLGNFTLPIARKCQSVIGIEGSHAMVKRAQDNAKLNEISNTAFYKADLADVKLNDSWMQQQFDKILLDPPRTGALEIIQQFPRWSAKRIVYISCNPATLARDVGELVHKQGYQLIKAGVLDMFPHTKHVESIALLIKDK